MRQSRSGIFLRAILKEIAGGATDRKSLLALRSVGPESEAESVRFHWRRVTKVAPEVKHGRRRGLKIRVRGITLAFSVRLAERYQEPEAKTTKEPTILKRTEPAFVEPCSASR